MEHEEIDEEVSGWVRGDFWIDQGFSPTGHPSFYQLSMEQRRCVGTHQDVYPSAWREEHPAGRNRSRRQLWIARRVSKWSACQQMRIDVVTQIRLWWWCVSHYRCFWVETPDKREESREREKWTTEERKKEERRDEKEREETPPPLPPPRV